MTTSQLRNVRGMRELGEALKRLPMEMKVQALRPGVRAGAAQIQKEARALAPKNTGTYAQGIRVKVPSAPTDDNVTAKIYTSGKHGYLGNWLEFTGAVQHEIEPRRKGGKKAVALRGEVGGFAADGGLVFAHVDHPGMKAKPHLRPALDNKADDAIMAVGNTIRRWLARRAGIKVAGKVSVGDAE